MVKALNLYWLKLAERPSIRTKKDACRAAVSPFPTIRTKTLDPARVMAVVSSRMTAPTLPGIPAWALPILFLTGLVAGFVDSIAGGGGLLTVPVLLSFNVPPAFAFGTNKLQASFGSGSAAWHFAQSGIVSLRECVLGVLFTIVGAA